MMNRLERAASLAATCVLVATAAAAAEIVVIESNSPRFMAGQLLDDSAPIELAAGQSLLIVTEDGRALRLDGPYAGPAVGAAPDAGAVRRAVERLVNADEPRVGGVGAVRGDESGASVDTRPDPWLVHAEIPRAVLPWRSKTPSAARRQRRVGTRARTAPHGPKAWPRPTGSSI
jgi:hypothetical protein